jgi:hypothetical protein
MKFNHIILKEWMCSEDKNDGQSWLAELYNKNKRVRTFFLFLFNSFFLRSYLR